MEKSNSVIIIDGQEYELVCNNKARKEIAEKLGSFEKLGEILSNSENYDETLDNFGWIVLCMINQGLAVYNYHHKDNPKPEMTMDEYDMLTNPGDYADFGYAVNAAIAKNSKRNVQSEDEPKNAEVE